MFEYRNWSDGWYEVSLKIDYNPLTKMFKYKGLGLVQKIRNGHWVCGEMTSKTRKEISEKLARSKGFLQ